MTTTILHGDCRVLLPTLPAGRVRAIISSPPYYGLRDYGAAGQIGLEATPEAYIAALVAVFREARRVLADDGTLWLNLGDSYASGEVGRHDNGRTSDPACGKNEKWQEQAPRAERRRPPVPGLPQKNLLGMPWRVALALQADGWYLRSDIIWAKGTSGQKETGRQVAAAMRASGCTSAQVREVLERLDLYVGNNMPESVTDRPTRAHEYLFLLSKSPRYYYDRAAIAEEVSRSTEWTYSQPDKAARAGITTNGMGAATLRERPADGMRNRRTVWCIPTRAYPGAHFAVMPEALVEPCILAATQPGDAVLDPFGGTGTIGRVAQRLRRDAILIELNAGYVPLALERNSGVQISMADLLSGEANV